MIKDAKDMEMIEILRVLKGKVSVCCDINDYEGARKMLIICELFDDWIDHASHSV